MSSKLFPMFYSVSVFVFVYVNNSKTDFWKGYYI